MDQFIKIEKAVKIKVGSDPWTVDSREDREEGCLFMHELQSSSETNLFFFFPSPFWTNEAAEKMENRQIDGDTD